MKQEIEKLKLTGSERYINEGWADHYKDLETEEGSTYTLLTQSGRANPDSDIGVYAGYANDYTQFKKLFDAIISDYHDYGSDGIHPTDFDSDQLPELTHLDPNGDRIKSIRIRVARSVEGYALPPTIKPNERAELNKKITSALADLQGELAGEYFAYGEMSIETRERLIEEHILFKEDDRFQGAAGINSDWPHYRGIFISYDKKFMVWVGEEDHLRIISLEEGSDLLSAYKRVAKAAKNIGAKIDFSSSSHLGYLTSCPSNLGTGMRASIMLQLPILGESGRLTELCEPLGLAVRGVHGEHSESVDGLYEISVKQRLGITENDIVIRLHKGIEHLICLETMA